MESLRRSQVDATLEDIVVNTEAKAAYRPRAVRDARDDEARNNNVEVPFPATPFDAHGHDVEATGHFLDRCVVDQSVGGGLEVPCFLGTGKL